MNPKTDSVSFCCGQRTKVIDSRAGASYGLRRRRECVACGRRFNTLEVFAPEDPDHTKLAGDMALLTNLSQEDLIIVRRLLERFRR
jgi:transcriptional regulator NrdR family protein